jgi:hypothetical protein
VQDTAFSASQATPTHKRCAHPVATSSWWTSSTSPGASRSGIGNLQAAEDSYEELQSLKSSQAHARGQGQVVLSSINGTCIYVDEADLCSKPPQDSADHTGTPIRLVDSCTCCCGEPAATQPPTNTGCPAISELLLHQYNGRSNAL